jgi:multiple sugar transport system substrate-binding protein
VSTFALYLNLDLIAEAGVEDPRVLAEEGNWDWAAFEKTADAITKTGGANKGFGVNSWWANYGYFMNSAGGGFFNEDRTECNLDDPKSIEGLRYMKGLYDKGLGVPFGEDAEPPFLAGTVGMFMNGRWATPGTRSGAKFNWDVVELPAGPAGSVDWLFWGAYVVNAKTENPDQAFALVQELTSVDTQGKISSLGANIPSRQSEEALEAFKGFTPPRTTRPSSTASRTTPPPRGRCGRATGRPSARRPTPPSTPSSPASGRSRTSRARSAPRTPARSRASEHDARPAGLVPAGRSARLEGRSA